MTKTIPALALAIAALTTAAAPAPAWAGGPERRLEGQAPQPRTTASVPRFVRVTGALTRANGPIAAVESVTFAIYADETGGTPLWQETQSIAVDPSGRYLALLGATLPNGVPLDVFTANDARWLGVQVQRVGEQEQPRVLLASVPYAIRASDADTLGGRPASAYQLVATGGAALPTPDSRGNRTRTSSAVTAIAGTTGSIAKFTSATDVGSSAMWENGGSIGINTAAPRDMLHVAFTNTTGTQTGLAVQNLGSTAASYSGMLFYDQNGALAQFQGFNNATHQYRINNIAPGGSINFMIGGSSKFLVSNNGDITIAGSLWKRGVRFLHDGGQQHSTYGGLESGSFTAIAHSNTGFGYAALTAVAAGNSNVAFGALALRANSDGVENAGIGTGALASSSTGSFNTGVGSGALGSNTTGEGNAALGALAGALSTIGSNNIYLGANVQGIAGESNAMYLGKVGLQTMTKIAGVRGITTGAADAVAVVIDGSGQLGTVNSSRRYKEDIQDMAEASSGLMKLRPVTFRYTQPYADGNKPIDYGLIAEEVEAVYPDLVAHLADGEVETVQYHKINAMLLNEVQKQHAALEQQRAEIAALTARLEAIERANRETRRPASRRR